MGSLNVTNGTLDQFSIILVLPPCEIFEITVGSVGVVGNSFVIMVMLGVKWLRRQNNNKFVVSLAFADLIASVFIILRSLQEILHFDSNLTWEVYCRVVHDTVLWVNFTASVFNLVALTLERYFAIVHPLKYFKLATPRRTAVVIATTWLLSIVPQLFTITIDTYDEESESCVYQWPPSPWIRVFVGVLIFLSTYIIPLIIMTWSYRKILRSLALSEKRTRTSHFSREFRTVVAKKKMANMFIAICLAFAICWGPNQCLFLAANCGYSLDYDGSAYKFSRGLVAVNSCINPFIYSCANKKFRAGVKVLLRCVNKVGNSWSSEPNDVECVVQRRATWPKTSYRF
ncbi:galanin receptor 2a-like [Ptychodera flava]|uniref:galanin receptor 2a-like n=1 Tax=Ptychodera flava TaxID=63121 RepID=UPI00396A7009